MYSLLRLNNREEKIDKDKYFILAKKDEHKDLLTWLEHRRWNAYMRSNGFTKLDITLPNEYEDKKVDLRLHPCIVECSKKKNIKVHDDNKEKADPIWDNNYEEIYSGSYDFLDLVSIMKYQTEKNELENIKNDDLNKKLEEGIKNIEKDIKNQIEKFFRNKLEKEIDSIVGKNNKEKLCEHIERERDKKIKKARDSYEKNCKKYEKIGNKKISDEEIKKIIENANKINEYRNDIEGYRQDLLKKIKKEDLKQWDEPSIDE
jgi:hypothetical protein